MIHTRTVGVIIPYYQRQRGILLRAVESVRAQALDTDTAVKIIIVDDSSPVSAEADLATLVLPAFATLRILHQDNAGPGAARNRGLEHAAALGCDFVSFLDSDDRWAPCHLARALEALSDDGDFFFDDHIRTQYGAASYMEHDRRLARWIERGVISLDSLDRLTVRPADVLQPFLRDCLAQTSTIVLRSETMGTLRFDTDLRSLGEDLLFMLQAATRARSVRLSDEVGTDCGEGVNIYHSALSWNHPDAPMRFAMSLLLWTRVEQSVALNARDREFVRSQISGFRRGFAYILARNWLKTRRVHRRSIELLRAKLGWRPASLITGLAGVVVRRLAGRQAFPEH